MKGSAVITDSRATLAGRLHDFVANRLENAG